MVRGRLVSTTQSGDESPFPFATKEDVIDIQRRHLYTSNFVL